MTQRQPALVDQSLLRQLRPLIAAVLLGLVVLGFVAVAGANRLMASYEQVEANATRQKGEQIYRAFEADLRQLEISNRDYAEWDDAEEYTRTRDPEFIRANFSTGTLQAMHVDIVWLFDADGRSLYSSAVDVDGKSALSPAPQRMLDELARFRTTDRGLRALSPAQRVARTQAGVTAVSVVEIARSDQSSPTGVMMLFARAFGPDSVARVRDATQLPIELQLDPIAAPPGTVSVEVPDDDWIVAGAQIRDLDAKTIARIVARQPREIRALGAHTTAALLWSIGVLLSGFIVTTFVLMTRHVKLAHRDMLAQREVGELARLHRRNLRKQSTQDSLTGLPNRNYLHARLDRVLKAFRRSGQTLAVVGIDLDHFKNINDLHGHPSGDEVLRVLARRLRASTSRHDLIVRMGGDEFVIVAPLMPEDDDAIARFVDRLRSAIGEEIALNAEDRVRVEASIGIATFPRDGANASDLLRHSDIALFQAKEAGRRCHRRFSATMRAAVNEHATLEQALRTALGSRGELYMDYQPIIDLRAKRVVSLEALMRWTHPQLGNVPPGRFIPVAERSGLILDVGELALRLVIEQMRAWQDEGVPIVPVAVNVSPLQIERTDFPAQVKRLASEAGIDLRFLRFEITESAMTKHTDRLIGALEELRSFGCKILIDDFGTGYSSLSYLNQLPIDILKIDRAFINELGKQGERSAILLSVLDMAKRLNLKAVAEGVETEAQALALNEQGCDFAQGYYFSKPISAARCASLLDRMRGEGNTLSDTGLLRTVPATT